MSESFLLMARILGKKHTYIYIYIYIYIHIHHFWSLGMAQELYQLGWLLPIPSRVALVFAGMGLELARLAAFIQKVSLTS